MEQKIEESGDVQTNQLLDIKMKLNSTLNHCLKMFDIHTNVERIIRNKMLNIIRKNKEIARLQNVEAIVFVLLIHAIKDLKIPLNKKKINEKIQNYIATNMLLKDLKHLNI